jgi:hypothetical protein
MDKTVDVTIPVEPEAAAALADARNREAVGRLVSEASHVTNNAGMPSSALTNQSLSYLIAKSSPDLLGVIPAVEVPCPRSECRDKRDTRRHDPASGPSLHLRS